MPKKKTTTNPQERALADANSMRLAMQRAAGGKTYSWTTTTTTPLPPPTLAASVPPPATQPNTTTTTTSPTPALPRKRPHRKIIHNVPLEQKANANAPQPPRVMPSITIPNSPPKRASPAPPRPQQQQQQQPRPQTPPQQSVPVPPPPVEHPPPLVKPAWRKTNLPMRNVMGFTMHLPVWRPQPHATGSS
ncbi:hypothetical protein DFJ77DRAFT_438947 [Powellomyces hirtus]|nr:hypothetical protein DFJ77DRAFT_438947 [Powellomyces hirtus]